MQPFLFTFRCLSWGQNQPIQVDATSESPPYLVVQKDEYHLILGGRLSFLWIDQEKIICEVNELFAGFEKCE